jgi:hypothetical protein
VLLSFLIVTTLRSTEAQYCSPGAGQAVCASVLVVYTDWPRNGADVQARLWGTGAFITVDTFNAGYATPTASQLAAYDAVFAYASTYTFSDAARLGDRLAAYHDQGGGVVVAALANGGLGNHLQGAYGRAENGYALLDYASGTYLYSSESLGDLLEPQSPLLTGVSSLTAHYATRNTVPVISGRGVVVARWRDGNPLVVRGVRGGRNLVELNVYPPSSSIEPNFWVGDGAVLMRNAIKYSRCMICGSGTFSPGETRCN